MRRTAILILLAATLAACGGAEPPAATPAGASPAVAQTATPSPPPTEEAPPPTATAPPTATPTGQPTATSTSPPTATPLPPTTLAATDSGLPCAPQAAATDGPHVAICTSAATLRVDETVSLVGEPVGITLLDYMIILRDRDERGGLLQVRVTHEGAVSVQETDSRVVGFVSAQASAERVIVVLRGVGAGTVEGGIVATGEVSQDEWGGGESALVTITVGEP